MFIEDLIEKPAINLEMMLTFAGLPFSRPEMMVAIPGFISQMKAALAISTSEFHDSNNGTGTINIADSREGLLKVPEEYLRVSAAAILDEMQVTKGLTRWPCESFRLIVPYGRAGKKETGAPLRDRLRMPPAMLAANCSSPYVKCSVPYDHRGG